MLRRTDLLCDVVRLDPIRLPILALSFVVALPLYGSELSDGPRVVFRLNTGKLGRVAVSHEDLARMQKSPYILHARNGELTEVPAEKVKLPYDPKGHPQGANVIRLSDGTIYVRQPTIMCKSIDGGRSWTSHPLAHIEGVPQDYSKFDDEKNPPPPASGKGHLQVLNDGSFMRITMPMGLAKGPFTVWKSTDEGRSWDRLTQIPVDVPWDYQIRYSHWGLSRLPDDDTLFFGMDLREEVKFVGEKWRTPVVSGTTRLVFYRSTDRGVTWHGPILVSPWCAEGGICRLPSGKLLAAVRYQRPQLVTDSPDILQRWDVLKGGGQTPKYPFKHIFLTESSDQGLTWTNRRQLSTVHGQCYGYPIALEDGTVIVIHDTRYGPGPQSGRAMISRDEGETWENEVYYIYYGKVESSYNQSVVLEDDTILTVGGILDRSGKPGHAGAVGYADFWAIRWKPVMH